MEYLSKKTRKVDAKRRILFPSIWREEGKIDFVFVDDGPVKIYPDNKWQSLMCAIEDEDEKIQWASKSTKVKLDTIGRLLLPKYCDWKQICFFGSGDYIIVAEVA